MQARHSIAESKARTRAEILLPGATLEFANPNTPPLSSTDFLCELGPRSGTAIPGFVQISSKPLKSYRPLHEVIAVIQPNIANLFNPNGIFHHVGSRLCATRVPDEFETLWIRESRQHEIHKPHPITSAFVELIVTVFGIGRLPVIGATTASTLACAIAATLHIFGLSDAVPMSMLTLCIFAAAAGVVLESAAIRHFIDSDPREFVIDELSGMALTLLFVPVSSGILGIIIAFLAFRFFDVVKPGIKWIEKHDWPGVITWDDLLAGIYAGITTNILISLPTWLSL